MSTSLEDVAGAARASGAANTEDAGVDPASYRDPSGFVFRRDGVVYRHIAPSYGAEWDALLASDLHRTLVDRGWLIDHEPAPSDASPVAGAHAVIRPERIDFISYPYEWTFGQLKDAALLTLDIQLAALDAGFTLKDASAYNIQFQRGRPVLIDSLSFERAEADAPWVAYRQFCEHFLAPLALMAYRDVRLATALRAFLDGIPLDLASPLLPRRTWLRFGLASHLHAHARMQRRYEAGSPAASTAPARLPRARLRALLGSLRAAVERLAWQPSGTEWADYADRTSYGDAATATKERLVGRFIAALPGERVWDLGANTGRYSRIAAEAGRRVIAFDVDPAASERHYRSLRSEGRSDTLPLVMDLANPSPSLGWAHAERRSLEERADADALLALALVHHLAISRNVPLEQLSAFLARLAPGLVLEWVPKEDEMVQRLLASRRDVFPGYSLDGFRAAFAQHWELLEEAPIEGTVRTLIRLRRR